MVIKTGSSPSTSPVTITVTSGSGGGARSRGLTSPIQRLSFSNNSPLSSSNTNANNNSRAWSGGGRRYSSSKKEEEEEAEEEVKSSSETIHPYTVSIPQTPEAAFQSYASVTTSIDAKSDVLKTIFTGGYGSGLRGRAMEKSIEMKKSELVCGMRGCDEAAIEQNKLKCECGFKICIACYSDRVKHQDSKCPGCNELYKVQSIKTEHTNVDNDEDEEEEVEEDEARSLPSMKRARARDEKQFSVVQSFRGGFNRQGSEFDHARWLYDTQGTYGYGNAYWPKDSGSDGFIDRPDFCQNRHRPLTRKINVPNALISPYRLLIMIRFLALSWFLAWRIRNPNPDAMWLSIASIVCEVWFAFSWLVDQLPKLCPVNRETDLTLLKELFETPNMNNPRGLSDLPGIDVFVSTADAEKEPPLVTANTILSILAVDYPVEKVACYLSDDGGSITTFEAMAVAARFARIWVPFCRKHQIEPRNPEAYFGQKKDLLKNQKKPNFVRDMRTVKRLYAEFKVEINGLPDKIRQRSDAYNVRTEAMERKKLVEKGEDGFEAVKVPKATWMADGFHWPGTWSKPSPDHARGDHVGIVQTMLLPASAEPVYGSPTAAGEEGLDSIDTSDTDIRLPMLVYVSREKRPGFDHNKKAGAMNALVRASAVLSNGPFILNLDCDHYVYNSQALREGMCFMLDRGGDRVCYVQFPQRFEGIDPSDRYANHNNVFFDASMRALDGLQGPMYVGTGCIFRRTALYGFSPARTTEHHGWLGTTKLKLHLRNAKAEKKKSEDEISLRINEGENEEDTLDPEEIEFYTRSKWFGNSKILIQSIPVAEYQGRLLDGIHRNKNYQGRRSGSLVVPCEPLDSSAVAEAVNVISCFYEDTSEWGKRVGWIYGSVTEDVVTGYRMHNRGWRSVYCVTKRDAFRGTAPINLTDRLHQVLRWATGSVEIFFSRNNALFATRRMKFLQRIAYFNVGMYPFTSFFLVLYCFLPAASLLTGRFIIQSLNVTFLLLLLIITLSLCILSSLEIRWSKITLHDWWRNEQFWLIGGTSAHPAAVIQGLLKLIAGVEISFTLTTKSATGEDGEDEFAELYLFKWTSLMCLPMCIILVNLFGIAVGVSRTIYSPYPQWSKLVGGVFFSLWVLSHLYPFAKGLMGKRGKIPTIVYLWSGLISIIVSMIIVYASNGHQSFSQLQFP
ncbi:hypothetical protein QQ045_003225 [Rhodiola kirilowii]